MRPGGPSPGKGVFALVLAALVAGSQAAVSVTIDGDWVSPVARALVPCMVASEQGEQFFGDTIASGREAYIASVPQDGRFDSVEAFLRARDSSFAPVNSTGNATVPSDVTCDVLVVVQMDGEDVLDGSATLSSVVEELGVATGTGLQAHYVSETSVDTVGSDLDLHTLLKESDGTVLIGDVGAAVDPTGQTIAYAGLTAYLQEFGFQNGVSSANTTSDLLDEGTADPAQLISADIGDDGSNLLQGRPRGVGSGFDAVYESVGAYDSASYAAVAAIMYNAQGGLASLSTFCADTANKYGLGCDTTSVTSQECTQTGQHCDLHITTDACALSVGLTGTGQCAIRSDYWSKWEPPARPIEPTTGGHAPSIHKIRTCVCHEADTDGTTTNEDEARSFASTLYSRFGGSSYAESVVLTDSPTALASMVESVSSCDTVVIHRGAEAHPDMIDILKLANASGAAVLFTRYVADGMPSETGALRSQYAGLGTFVSVGYDSGSSNHVVNPEMVYLGSDVNTGGYAEITERPAGFEYWVKDAGAGGTDENKFMMAQVDHGDGFVVGLLVAPSVSTVQGNLAAAFLWYNGETTPMKEAGTADQMGPNRRPCLYRGFNTTNSECDSGFGASDTYADCIGNYVGYCDDCSNNYYGEGCSLLASSCGSAPGEWNYAVQGSGPRYQKTCAWNDATYPAFDYTGGLKACVATANTTKFQIVQDMLQVRSDPDDADFISSVHATSWGSIHDLITGEFCNMVVAVLKNGATVFGDGVTESNLHDLASKGGMRVMYVGLSDSVSTTITSHDYSVGIAAAVKATGCTKQTGDSLVFESSTSGTYVSIGDGESVDQSIIDGGHYQCAGNDWLNTDGKTHLVSTPGAAADFVSAVTLIEFASSGGSILIDTLSLRSGASTDDYNLDSYRANLWLELGDVYTTDVCIGWNLGENRHSVPCAPCDALGDNAVCAKGAAGTGHRSCATNWANTGGSLPEDGGDCSDCVVGKYGETCSDDESACAADGHVSRTYWHHEIVEGVSGLRKDRTCAWKQVHENHVVGDGVVCILSEGYVGTEAQLESSFDYDDITVVSFASRVTFWPYITDESNPRCDVVVASLGLAGGSAHFRGRIDELYRNANYRFVVGGHGIGANWNKQTVPSASFIVGGGGAGGVQVGGNERADEDVSVRSAMGSYYEVGGPAYFFYRLYLTGASAAIHTRAYLTERGDTVMASVFPYYNATSGHSNGIIFVASQYNFAGEALPHLAISAVRDAALQADAADILLQSSGTPFYGPVPLACTSDSGDLDASNWGTRWTCENGPSGDGSWDCMPGYAGPNCVPNAVYCAAKSDSSVNTCTFDIDVNSVLKDDNRVAIDGWAANPSDGGKFTACDSGFVGANCTAVGTFCAALNAALPFPRYDTTVSTNPGRSTEHCDCLTAFTNSTTGCNVCSGSRFGEQCEETTCQLEGTSPRDSTHGSHADAAAEGYMTSIYCECRQGNSGNTCDESTDYCVSGLGGEASITHLGEVVALLDAESLPTLNASNVLVPGARLHPYVPEQHSSELYAAAATGDHCREAAVLLASFEASFLSSDPSDMQHFRETVPPLATPNVVFLGSSVSDLHLDLAYLLLAMDAYMGIPFADSIVNATSAHSAGVHISYHGSGVTHLPPSLGIADGPDGSGPEPLYFAHSALVAIATANNITLTVLYADEATPTLVRSFQMEKGGKKATFLFYDSVAHESPEIAQLRGVVMQLVIRDRETGCWDSGSPDAATNAYETFCSTCPPGYEIDDQCGKCVVGKFGPGCALTACDPVGSRELSIPTDRLTTSRCQCLGYWHAGPGDCSVAPVASSVSYGPVDDNGKQTRRLVYLDVVGSPVGAWQMPASSRFDVQMQNVTTFTQFNDPAAVYVATKSTLPASRNVDLTGDAANPGVSWVRDYVMRMEMPVLIVQNFGEEVAASDLNTMFGFNSVFIDMDTGMNEGDSDFVPANAYAYIGSSPTGGIKAIALNAPPPSGWTVNIEPVIQYYDYASDPYVSVGIITVSYGGANDVDRVRFKGYYIGHTLEDMSDRAYKEVASALLTYSAQDWSDGAGGGHYGFDLTVPSSNTGVQSRQESMSSDGAATCQTNYANDPNDNTVCDRCASGYYDYAGGCVKTDADCTGSGGTVNGDACECNLAGTVYDDATKECTTSGVTGYTWLTDARFDGGSISFDGINNRMKVLFIDNPASRAHENASVTLNTYMQSVGGGEFAAPFTVVSESSLKTDVNDALTQAGSGTGLPTSLWFVRQEYNYLEELAASRGGIHVYQLPHASVGLPNTAGLVLSSVQTDAAQARSVTLVDGYDTTGMALRRSVATGGEMMNHWELESGSPASVVAWLEPTSGGVRVPLAFSVTKGSAVFLYLQSFSATEPPVSGAFAQWSGLLTYLLRTSAGLSNTDPTLVHGPSMDSCAGARTYEPTYGTCNHGLMGDGSVTCKTGYTDAGTPSPVCGSCVNGYRVVTGSPDTCVACNDVSLCSGRGTCALNTEGQESVEECTCELNYGTTDCSGCANHWTGADCNTCPNTHTGSSCNLVCLTGTGGSVCSGHGSCYASSSTTAACSCENSHYGEECATAKPTGTGGAVCSGSQYGAWNAQTEVCDCQPGRSGTACETIVANWRVNSGNGAMECVDTHVSDTTNCQHACPLGVGDAVCSGHGVCSFNGTAAVCTCASGFGGDACERCSNPLVTYASGCTTCELTNGESSTCLESSSCDATGTRRSGGEPVIANGRCVCNSTYNREGYLCDECPTGFRGPRCSVSCATCTSNGGTCPSTDPYGSVTCVCPAGTTGTDCELCTKVRQDGGSGSGARCTLSRKVCLAAHKDSRNYLSYYNLNDLFFGPSADELPFFVDHLSSGTSWHAAVKNEISSLTCDVIIVPSVEAGYAAGGENSLSAVMTELQASAKTVIFLGSEHAAEILNQIPDSTAYIPRAYQVPSAQVDLGSAHVDVALRGASAAADFVAAGFPEYVVGRTGYPLTTIDPHDTVLYGDASQHWITRVNVPSSSAAVYYIADALANTDHEFLSSRSAQMRQALVTIINQALWGGLSRNGQGVNFAMSSYPTHRPNPQNWQWNGTQCQGSEATGYFYTSTCGSENTLNCNGHGDKLEGADWGVRVTVPSCTCHESPSKGYWKKYQSEWCNECWPGHGGSECRKACPGLSVGASSDFNLVCNSDHAVGATCSAYSASSAKGDKTQDPFCTCPNTEQQFNGGSGLWANPSVGHPSCTRCLNANLDLSRNCTACVDPLARNTFVDKCQKCQVQAWGTPDTCTACDTCNGNGVCKDSDHPQNNGHCLCDFGYDPLRRCEVCFRNSTGSSFTGIHADNCDSSTLSACFLPGTVQVGGVYQSIDTGGCHCKANHTDTDCGGCLNDHYGTATSGCVEDGALCDSVGTYQVTAGIGALGDNTGVVANKVGCKCFGVYESSSGKHFTGRKCDICPTGWFHWNCSRDIEWCRDGGSAVATEGTTGVATGRSSTGCQCAPGFAKDSRGKCVQCAPGSFGAEVGSICQKTIADCHPTNTLGVRTGVLNDGCICKPGYTGTDCSEEIDSRVCLLANSDWGQSGDADAGMSGPIGSDMLTGITGIHGVTGATGEAGFIAHPTVGPVEGGSGFVDSESIHESVSGSTGGTAASGSNGDSFEAHAGGRLLRRLRDVHGKTVHVVDLATAVRRVGHHDGDLIKPYCQQLFVGPSYSSRARHATDFRRILDHGGSLVSVGDSIAAVQHVLGGSPCADNLNGLPTPSSQHQYLTASGVGSGTYAGCPRALSGEQKDPADSTIDSAFYFMSGYAVAFRELWGDGTMSSYITHIPATLEDSRDRAAFDRMLDELVDSPNANFDATAPDLYYGPDRTPCPCNPDRDGTCDGGIGQDLNLLSCFCAAHEPGLDPALNCASDFESCKAGYMTSAEGVTCRVRARVYVLDVSGAGDGAMSHESDVLAVKNTIETDLNADVSLVNAAGMRGAFAADDSAYDRVSYLVPPFKEGASFSYLSEDRRLEGKRSGNEFTELEAAVEASGVEVVVLGGSTVDAYTGAVSSVSNFLDLSTHLLHVAVKEVPAADLPAQPSMQMVRNAQGALPLGQFVGGNLQLSADPATSGKQRLFMAQVWPNDARNVVNLTDASGAATVPSGYLTSSLVMRLPARANDASGFTLVGLAPTSPDLHSVLYPLVMYSTEAELFAKVAGPGDFADNDLEINVGYNGGACRADANGNPTAFGALCQPCPCRRINQDDTSDMHELCAVPGSSLGADWSLDQYGCTCPEGTQGTFCEICSPDDGAYNRTNCRCDRSGPSCVLREDQCVNGRFYSSSGATLDTWCPCHATSANGFYENAVGAQPMQGDSACTVCKRLRDGNDTVTDSYYGSGELECKLLASENCHATQAVFSYGSSGIDGSCQCRGNYGGYVGTSTQELTELTKCASCVGGSSQTEGYIGATCDVEVAVCRANGGTVLAGTGAGSFARGDRSDRRTWTCGCPAGHIGTDCGTCASGWYSSVNAQTDGVACVQCPGYSNSGGSVTECSGHGVCASEEADAPSEQCTCDASATNGYWAGPSKDCSRCDEDGAGGHYWTLGAHRCAFTAAQCTEGEVVEDLAVAGGYRCQPNAGWDVSAGTNQQGDPVPVFDCDTEHYGSTCQHPCSTCLGGGGATSGGCDSGLSGGCACANGFAGPACLQCGPDNAGDSCQFHRSDCVNGVFHQGRNRTADNWCVCYADATRGHWGDAPFISTGKKCDTCKYVDGNLAETYTTDTCTKTCAQECPLATLVHAQSTSPGAGQYRCFAHTENTATYTGCVCKHQNEDPNNGCQTCKNGFWGPNCEFPTSLCHGSDAEPQGRTATCSPCYSDVDNGGKFAGTFCGTCNSDVYGDGCNHLKSTCTGRGFVLTSLSNTRESNCVPPQDPSTTKWAKADGVPDESEDPPTRCAPGRFTLEHEAAACHGGDDSKCCNGLASGIRYADVSTYADGNPGAGIAGGVQCRGNTVGDYCNMCAQDTWGTVDQINAARDPPYSMNLTEDLPCQFAASDCDATGGGSFVQPTTTFAEGGSDAAYGSCENDNAAFSGQFQSECSDAAAYGDQCDESCDACDSVGGTSCTPGRHGSGCACDANHVGTNCDRCATGKYGDDCTLTVLNCHTAGTNHSAADGGVVTGRNGHCACYDSPTRGKWTGRDCDGCADDMFDQCRKRGAAYCVMGATRNGTAQERVAFQTCACQDGWAGADCGICASGRWSKDDATAPAELCTQQQSVCQGTVTTQTLNASSSLGSQGVRSTGRCTCASANFERISTFACDEGCQLGYYGDTCELTCAANQLCDVEGTCSVATDAQTAFPALSGLTDSQVRARITESSKDGLACACSGLSSGTHCEGCVSGAYKDVDGYCVRCPGSDGGDVCSGHGTCADYASDAQNGGGDGKCTCESGWIGTDCSSVGSDVVLDERTGQTIACPCGPGGFCPVDPQDPERRWDGVCSCYDDLTEGKWRKDANGTCTLCSGVYDVSQQCKQCLPAYSGHQTGCDACAAAPPQRYGDQCQQVVASDRSDAAPCLHGSAFVEVDLNGKDFSCTCKNGWSGEFCGDMDAKYEYVDPGTAHAGTRELQCKQNFVVATAGTQDDNPVCSTTCAVGWANPSDPELPRCSIADASLNFVLINGELRCATGWREDSSNPTRNCAACDTGFAGDQCVSRDQFCPTHRQEPSADAVDATCVCTTGYTGTPIPYATSGQDPCGTCDSTHYPSSAGVCSACRTDCDHGEASCGATGTGRCMCDADPTSGYYALSDDGTCGRCRLGHDPSTGCKTCLSGWVQTHQGGSACAYEYPIKSADIVRLDDSQHANGVVRVPCLTQAVSKPGVVATEANVRSGDAGYTTRLAVTTPAMGFDAPGFEDMVDMVPSSIGVELRAYDEDGEEVAVLVREVLPENAEVGATPLTALYGVGSESDAPLPMSKWNSLEFAVRPYSNNVRSIAYFVVGRDRMTDVVVRHRAFNATAACATPGTAVNEGHVQLIGATVSGTDGTAVEASSTRLNQELAAQVDATTGHMDVRPCFRRVGFGSVEPTSTLTVRLDAELEKVSNVPDAAALAEAQKTLTWEDGNMGVRCATFRVEDVNAASEFAHSSNDSQVANPTAQCGNVQLAVSMNVTQVDVHGSGASDGSWEIVNFVVDPNQVGVELLAHFAPSSQFITDWRAASSSTDRVEAVFAAARTAAANSPLSVAGSAKDEDGRVRVHVEAETGAGAGALGSFSILRAQAVRPTNAGPSAEAHPVVLPWNNPCSCLDRQTYMGYCADWAAHEGVHTQATAARVSACKVSDECPTSYERWSFGGRNIMERERVRGCTEESESATLRHLFGGNEVVEPVSYDEGDAVSVRVTTTFLCSDDDRIAIAAHGVSSRRFGLRVGGSSLNGFANRGSSVRCSVDSLVNVTMDECDAVFDVATACDSVSGREDKVFTLHLLRTPAHSSPRMLQIRAVNAEANCQVDDGLNPDGVSPAWVPLTVLDADEATVDRDTDRLPAPFNRVFPLGGVTADNTGEGEADPTIAAVFLAPVRQDLGGTDNSNFYIGSLGELAGIQGQDPQGLDQSKVRNPFAGLSYHGSCMATLTEVESDGLSAFTANDVMRGVMDEMAALQRMSDHLADAESHAQSGSTSSSTSIRDYIDTEFEVLGKYRTTVAYGTSLTDFPEATTLCAKMDAWMQDPSVVEHLDRYNIELRSSACTGDGTAAVLHAGSDSHAGFVKNTVTMRPVFVVVAAATNEIDGNGEAESCPYHAHNSPSVQRYGVVTHSRRVSTVTNVRFCSNAFHDVSGAWEQMGYCEDFELHLGRDPESNEYTPIYYFNGDGTEPTVHVDINTFGGGNLQSFTATRSGTVSVVSQDDAAYSTAIYADFKRSGFEIMRTLVYEWSVCKPRTGGIFAPVYACASGSANAPAWCYDDLKRCDPAAWRTALDTPHIRRALYLQTGVPYFAISTALFPFEQVYQLVWRGAHTSVKNTYSVELCKADAIEQAQTASGGEAIKYDIRPAAFVAHPEAGGCGEYDTTADVATATIEAMQSSTGPWLQYIEARAHYLTSDPAEGATGVSGPAARRLLSGDTFSPTSTSHDETFSTQTTNSPTDVPTGGSDVTDDEPAPVAPASDDKTDVNTGLIISTAVLGASLVGAICITCIYVCVKNMGAAKDRGDKTKEKPGAPPVRRERRRRRAKSARKGAAGSSTGSSGRSSSPPSRSTFEVVGGPSDSAESAAPRISVDTWDFD